MKNEENQKERWRNLTMNALKGESVEKILEMTGEIALIDAKIANTYIVYIKDGKMVREYPNGDIVEVRGEKNDWKSRISNNVCSCR